MIDFRDPKPGEVPGLIIRKATPEEEARALGIREPTEKEQPEIQLDNATAGLGGIDGTLGIVSEMVTGAAGGLGSLPTLGKAGITAGAKAITGDTAGAGKALRSTLPFGVNGSASRLTNVAGTMYSGSHCRRY